MTIINYMRNIEEMSHAKQAGGLDFEANGGFKTGFPHGSIRKTRQLRLGNGRCYRSAAPAPHRSSSDCHKRRILRRTTGCHPFVSHSSRRPPQLQHKELPQDVVRILQTSGFVIWTRIVFEQLISPKLK